MTLNVHNISSALLKSNYFFNLLPNQDKDICEIKKEDTETFTPKAGKGWTDLVQAEDLFENPTCEQKQIFHKKWIFDLLMHENRKTKSQEFKNVLVNNGYSDKKAEETIEYVVSNIKRVKETAEELERFGKIASIASSATIITGILSGILSGIGEYVSNVSSIAYLKKAVDITYGLFRSTRSYHQGSMYSRPDDDAKRNNFEALVYDNKISGYTGSLATFWDTKINSWLFALNELLPENVLPVNLKNTIKKICSTFTPLWFRVRMLANINQAFFTDFFRYIFHLIPATLFKREESIQILEDVKKRDNLNFKYLWSRVCRLSGVTGVNGVKDQTITNYIKQIGKLLKGTFKQINTREDINKQIKEKKESAKKLNETIAPYLGFYGTFAMAIGLIGHSVKNLFNKEDKTFDFIYSTSVFTQQLIYLPRMVMPLFIDSKLLKHDLLNSEYTKDFSADEIADLKQFAQNQNRLAYSGVISFFLSFLNTAFKLMKFENPLLKTFKNILDEVSNGLIQRFFSRRRHLIGNGFKVHNPKLYKDD